MLYEFGRLRLAGGLEAKPGELADGLPPFESQDLVDSLTPGPFVKLLIDSYWPNV